MIIIALLAILLFLVLFKYLKRNKDENSFNLSNKFTPMYDRLEYKMIYFVKCTTIDDLYEYLDYFGRENVKRKLNEFVDLGYVHYINGTDKLKILKVENLKSILKQYGLKVSGKKDDLIERIEENISENDIKRYLPTVQYIGRTEKGNDFYHQLLQIRDQELTDVFCKVANLVMKNNYNAAQKLCDDYYKINHLKCAIPTKMDTEKLQKTE